MIMANSYLHLTVRNDIFNIRKVQQK